MHGPIAKSIYCHWDGYLDHNGRILLEHYDSSKANELVSLGDMSTLRPEIGTPHSFSQFELEEMDREDFVRATENMCTFYGRDRGEENVGWKVAHTFEELFDQVEGGGGEWYYVMRDGEWYCGNTYESDTRFYKKLVLLAEALADEVIEEESKTWETVDL
jgi:hypothetical protein